MLHQWIFPRVWSIAVVLSIGLIATLLVTNFVWQLQQQNLTATFFQFAADDVFAINTALEWYLEPLDAVSAFYTASFHVKREEFSTFVRSFLVSRPGIYTVEWIPRVFREQRSGYETAIRADRLAGSNFFRVAFTEYQAGELVTAQARPEYYPIYFQEPIINDGALIGFDLGSEPRYGQALATAGSQGQAVAIERFAFAEAADPTSLVVQVFYPLYKYDAPQPTWQERQAGLKSNSHCQRLCYVKHWQQDGRAVAQSTQSPIYKQATDLEQKALYRYSTSSTLTSFQLLSFLFNWKLERYKKTMILVRPIEIAGQRWDLVLQPTTMYLVENRQWYHWFVFLAGLLLASVVAIYIHLMLDKNKHAEALVGKRTVELSQANDQLQKTLEELQFQKTLLECTSESAQDGILVVSPQREWLFFNQRFCDLWQIPDEIAQLRSSEEGIRWIVAQVANPQTSKQNIDQLYTDPYAAGYSEVRLKNGAVYERFSAPVKRADGVVYGRVWYFRDISQRKKTEEALLQSEARTRALISAIPDLLFRVHKDGCFLDYHSAASYTPMKAPVEFLGKNVADIFPAEAATRLLEQIADVLASGEICFTEYTMPMLNGEVRAWEQRVAMINEEEVLLIIRDITARRQAEEALRNSQQQLQERQQLEKQLVEEELARVRNQLVVQTRFATMGQVAATIAHELRNPLGAVRNAAYYIRRYLVQNKTELAEFLEIIETEITTADRIITDLLEMTRAKEPVVQAINLSEVAYEIGRQLKQNSTVTFRCSVSEEPFLILADPTQFRQILVNLVTNAAQAMADGGELVITGERSDGYDLITVQDNGPGVSPEIRERIFEPLFTTKAKGTGLGLAICRQIVEKHGGSITLADSECGATFSIRLPSRKQAPTQA